MQPRGGGHRKAAVSAKVAAAAQAATAAAGTADYSWQRGRGSSSHHHRGGNNGAYGRGKHSAPAAPAAPPAPAAPAPAAPAPRAPAPPAPPPPAQIPPAEGVGLLDVLQRVAPQAKISESQSQLPSKASDRSFSQMMMEVPSFTPDRLNPLDEETFGDGALPSNWLGPEEARPLDKVDGEDDDEDFFERWNGLFSKNSPLVNGSAEDPFLDVDKLGGKLRGKVVWKKNNQRPGHHKRYLERRQAKRREDEDESEALEPNGVGSTAWEPARSAWYQDHGEGASRDWDYAKHAHNGRGFARNGGGNWQTDAVGWHRSATNGKGGARAGGYGAYAAVGASALNCYQ